MKLFEKIEIAQFNFEKKNRFVAFWTNPFYLMRKGLYLNIKELAPELKGTVLDFGCGSKPYEYLFTNCTEYKGVDIDQSGHKHTNEKIDYFYDGHKLPFENESFDNVFTSEVIEHISNIDEIFDEINRVLKKGGLFFVTTPFLWNENETPYDYARYTSFGLKALLEKHGFEVIEQRKSMNYIQIIYQMKAEYWRIVFSKFKSLTVKRIVQLLIISSITFKGLLFGVIFPKDDSLYGNNIFMCIKK